MLRRALFAAVALLAAAPAHAQTQAHPSKTLKVVMQSDLKIIDPVWTTAYIVRNHGYLIYDTLFALDAKLEARPQMVESWTVSDDQLTWTFKLRDGLKWHDGQPVTTADVLPSIKRFTDKDTLGGLLAKQTREMKALDDRTFQIVLNKPYGMMLKTLAKTSSIPPFIMPKRVAETPVTQQISDTTGSGPFIFKKDEWKPGEKVVYLRNPDYRPRAEPPSGLAGGKVVKVDRVEIIEMPDPQQQVNAIAAGEIDLIEQPPHDLIPVLKKEKGVTLFNWNPLGHQFIFRMNWLQPPFNNPKIREAALLSIRQEDYLKATVGEPEFYKVCTAAFICGTPNAVDAPGDLFVKPNFEKSKALLKEAGYDGTPIVLLQSTTLPVLTNTAPVTKALLEQGGFKVDMQSMDWQTVVTRRTNKGPVSQGGWNIFHTFSVAADILNPISTSYMVANGDKAWFGWPNDPEMEKLRDAYAKETDPVKNKALAAAVQARALQTAQYGWIGQWYGPGAMRSNISGWLKAPVPVMWNIEKK